MLRNFIFSLMVLTTALFANSLSLEGNGDGTWNVGYISDAAIGGFQFDVDGASVTAASGGDATSSGFMLSTSSTTVLGFSLTGGTVAPGEGTLLVLTLDGEPTGLSGIVVSNAAGQALDFDFDGGDAADDGGADDGGADDGGAGVIGDEPNSFWLNDDNSVGFNSDYAIGGFQFNVDGASINSASGGEASANGFTLSASSTTVLGFSLTGSTIPAQDGGVLLELDLSGVPTGLSNLVVSDASGGALEFTYDDGGSDDGGSDVEGCIDSSACNYDSDATIDDGSCEFAEENFNCDGECVVDIDCNGDCGGSAELDNCGVCDGPGAISGLF